MSRMMHDLSLVLRTALMTSAAVVFLMGAAGCSDSLLRSSMNRESGPDADAGSPSTSTDLKKSYRFDEFGYELMLPASGDVQPTPGTIRSYSVNVAPELSRTLNVMFEEAVASEDLSSYVDRAARDYKEARTEEGPTYQQQDIVVNGLAGTEFASTAMGLPALTILHDEKAKRFIQIEASPKSRDVEVAQDEAVRLRAVVASFEKRAP